MIKKSDIKEVPIDSVKPYENNPRENDDAVEGVVNSIKEFGFISPIIVDNDNTILAGHTRLKAAQQMELKKVPVVVVSGMSEAQKHAYRLADNKVSEAAVWDFEKLDKELEASLDVFTGFSDMFLDEDLDTNLDDYEEPEADKETVRVALLRVNGKYVAKVVDDDFNEEEALDIKNFEV